MTTPVLMPVITEPGEDGVVTAWLVDEGSPVTAGALIAEVQAEKVSQDVEAPVAGVVVDLVPINQPVPQGEPICRIRQPSEETGEGEAAPAPPPEEAAPVTVDRRVAASPAARRVAGELGVDLAEVSGSGPGGRITEDDVRQVAEGPAGAVTLTGLRAVIARNLRESAQRSAAVTLTTRAVLADRPGNITAGVIAAAARTLLQYPTLNGTTEGDRFLPGDGVHISVAVQTESGLVAPCIRSADQRSVEDVAAEVDRLAARARAGELTADELRGGTFSVTNLGAYGIDAFTPIINPPQIAILGVGALRLTPEFDQDGTLVARHVMTLSLTFDHAFVDGAPAAAFLAELRRRLEAG